MRQALILAVALSSAAALHAADEHAANVPILTVCQALRGAAQYSGQTVIVVGRAVDAPEDAWIDEGCGLVLAFGDHRFPAAISTKYDASETAEPPALPKGFKWDKKAIERALAEVESTSHLQPKTSWCAAYGRLEVDPVRRIDLGNGRFAETVGYGHGGGAAAQLVGPADGVLHLKGK
ncbi:MAG TPA: hypothetical protein VHW09_26175 [Bryobacteraceae bacterium]|jgi:hypothetical protein|nr:hypothetical protein [Bryobacteraceae bacterium]